MPTVLGTLLAESIPTIWYQLQQVIQNIPGVREQQKDGTRPLWHHLRREKSEPTRKAEPQLRSRTKSPPRQGISCNALLTKNQRIDNLIKILGCLSAQTMVPVWLPSPTRAMTSARLPRTRSTQRLKRLFVQRESISILTVNCPSLEKTRLCSTLPV